MPETSVDKLYKDLEELVDFLSSSEETSLEVTARDVGRRCLMLAIGSYFEHTLCKHVLDFIASETHDCEPAVQFVKNKAITRQYHTWFEWKAKNASNFFALFGPGFKTHMEELVKANDHLNESIKAFLEMGQTRNRLAHQDYSVFTSEKTSEEAYEKFKIAIRFVEQLPRQLAEYSEDQRSHGGANSGD